VDASLHGGQVAQELIRIIQSNAKVLKNAVTKCLFMERLIECYMQQSYERFTAESMNLSSLSFFKPRLTIFQRSVECKYQGNGE